MRLSPRRLAAAPLVGVVGYALLYGSPEPARLSRPTGPGPSGTGWPEVVHLRLLAKKQLAREVAAGRQPLLKRGGRVR
jgi:hypothetical protein